MKYKELLITSLACLIFCSCSKSILDKEPQDEFTSSDVWSNIDLAKDYLNSIYRGIGQWGITLNQSPQVMPNSATDEALQRGDHGVWVLNSGKITAENYGTFDNWKGLYKSIRRCNIFLENIDEVSDATEDEIRSMKAQVRFIRAKNYADLIDWYSWWNGDHNGVPIIEKPFELDDNFKVERANYSEVVNFIINELDDAASRLPLEWDSKDWGHVTRGAALALKSEILLYAASPIHNPNMDQSKWQKAADAAKDLIEMKQYNLVQVDNWQDYANIFLKENPEIILARPYDPQFVDNKWVDFLNTPNGYGGWGGNCPTQQFVDKFEMANGKAISDPSSGYDPQDPYDNRELRFYADIVFNGRMYRGRKVQFYTPGGIDSQDGPEGWNTSPTGYTLYKFMDESIDIKTTVAPTPFIIFRLAEIYLNYAEAEYHLGNEAIAKEYVNKIRTRAKMPLIQSSGKQLLDDIRHERSIELAFEKDIRWNDVRRWKILEQTASQDYMKMKITKTSSGSFKYVEKVAMERSFHDRMYSLPIPFEEIQKSGLTQNPGY